jgi:hypothetical protein
VKLRIPPSDLPSTLPSLEAIRSLDDNQHSYEPEFLEFQYEICQYLIGIPLDSLQSRYEGILKNMKLLVSLDRDVIPIQSFYSSWYWYRKEHQTRLEFFNRGIALSPPPCKFVDESKYSIPRPSHPNSGDILFRYDRKFFTQRLVENGEIRIKPAHSNGDSSLDSARRDDELTKSTFTLRRHARITTQDGRNIPVRGDVRRTTIGPDYYMLSMSCDWNPNLKDTFGGSCAVIQMLSQHDLALRQGLS